MGREHPLIPRRWPGLARFAWIGTVVGLVALVFLAASLAGPFSRVRQRAADRVCAENLRLLILGLQEYTQDHGGYLPPGPIWGDVTLPYVHIEKAYTCPLAPDLGRRAYAYYDRLVDSPLSELVDPAQEPLLYDSDLGTWNARDSEVSPVPKGRHHGGNFIAFADGHVRWVPVGARFGEPRWKALPPVLPPHRNMGETVPVLLYNSRATGASFEYPAQWTLTDEGSTVTVASRDSGASIRLTVATGYPSPREPTDRTGSGFGYNVPVWGAIDSVAGWISETADSDRYQVALVCSQKGRTFRLTISAPIDRWPDVQDIAWSVIESFSLTQGARTAD